MAVKRKIIQVPKGTVPKLCKAFRCHKTAVYDALNFTTESELAHLIRQSAVTMYGGVETTKVRFI